MLTTLKITRLGEKIFTASGLSFIFFHVVFVSIIFPLCVLFRFWTPPVNSLMIYRAVFTGDRVAPIKAVEIQKLSKKVPEMFVFLEDHGFYRHSGIDLGAIKAAYEKNKTRGRFAYGGSTITQQLARTLFLTPHKNYLRKYLEAVIALEIDLLLPKGRIMELYLNQIEWGRGIFGLGRAAEEYYKKPAENLSMDQYYRLAAVIPSPRLYSVKNLDRHGGLKQRYKLLRYAFS